MTKRETCEWATQLDAIASRCDAPIPAVVLPDLPNEGFIPIVWDDDCARCPCWLAKDAPGPSVEARCPACGETWMSPAVLVPENDPAVCVECMIELAGEKNDA